MTDGEGFVHARGGPLIRIGAGDVIVMPPSEWHWHGAALPDHLEAHLAFTEGDTESGVHLTADQYPSEPHPLQNEGPHAQPHPTHQVDSWLTEVLIRNAAP